MVGRERLELSANGLKGRCSTIELPTRVDARKGVEPSIALLQRAVLPFDHPALLAEDVLAGYSNNGFFINRFTCLDAHKTFMLVRVVCNPFRLTVERCYSYAFTSDVSVNIFTFFFHHSFVACWLNNKLCVL